MSYGNRAAMRFTVSVGPHLQAQRKWSSTTAELPHAHGIHTLTPLTHTHTHTHSANAQNALPIFPPPS